MTEMVHGTLPLRAGEPVLPRWWRTVDKWSMGAILALFSIGLLLGLAASVPLAERNDLPTFHYVQRQLFFGVVAILVMIAVSMAEPRLIRRIGTVLFIVALIGLMLLPFFGTNYGKGAVRWFSLGFGSIQPSEFLKPGFVIVSAWLIAAAQDIGGPPGRAWSFGLLVIVVALLVLQPDFGQASLVLFGWGVVYFVSGAPMRILLVVGSIVAAGGFVAYSNSAHFASRINGFLSAEVDPRTQIGYATTAIQNGGFFGTGVGEGQVKWQLPDAHTDFIIAVAAEEYGLVLVTLIILLYATVVVRSLMRLTRERDPFTRLAGAGLACIFTVQAMINMGVAVRLLPTKGMTLPFVSYGGSSVVAAGLTVGALLALTRMRPQGELGDHLLRRGR
jgi:cell division protein FtsW